MNRPPAGRPAADASTPTRRPICGGWGEPGGILGILAGIGAFVWPGITLYVVAVFVAWYLVVGGILSVISAFAGPKRDWWWVGIVAGIAQFVLGVWAVGSPGRQLLLLVNLVGIYMIFFGVSEIFAGFAVRSQREENPA